MPPKSPDQVQELSPYGALRGNSFRGKFSFIIFRAFSANIQFAAGEYGKYSNIVSSYTSSIKYSYNSADV